MRIVSLNVNGLRAFDNKNGNIFNDFCLKILKADIICLQEIKGSEGNLARYSALNDYQTFSSIFIKGRHGVATLVKKNLFCNSKEEIVKGRILKTNHGNFVVYNCYMPYCDEQLQKDKTEIIKIYDLLKNEIQTRRAIICGDFNATYNILDHYQFKNELDTILNIQKWTSNVRLISSELVTEKMIEKNKILDRLKKASEDFMDDTIIQDKVKKIRPTKVELPYHFFNVEALEEYFFEVYQRRWMKDFITLFKDTFRMYNDNLEQYTCWNTIFNLRPINFGTRIDYVLCTDDIECIGSGILPDIKGSDHCPVFADFRIEKYEEDKEKNLVKRKNNLLGFFKVSKKD